MSNVSFNLLQVYWTVGEDGKIPAAWPDSFNTKINEKSPMNFTFMDNKYRTFIAVSTHDSSLPFLSSFIARTNSDIRKRWIFQSSPPPFSPKGRTNDIDAILYCIEKAEKFIHIAVMDYFPLTIYTAKIKWVLYIFDLSIQISFLAAVYILSAFAFACLFAELNLTFPGFCISKSRYWPIIDDALRTAAIERKIQVRLLISSWKHSRKSEIFFLKSLVELTDSYAGVNIEVVSIDTGAYVCARILHTSFRFLFFAEADVSIDLFFFLETIRGSHHS